jgi:hypothetical protein
MKKVHAFITIQPTWSKTIKENGIQLWGFTAGCSVGKMKLSIKEVTAR